MAEELGNDFVMGGLTAMAGVLLEPGKIRDFSRVPSHIGEIRVWDFLNEPEPLQID